MALVASRLSEGSGRDPSDLRAVAVNDSLRAAFVLGLQRVFPERVVHRRVHGPARASGCARTPTRSRCCDALRRPRTGSCSRSRTGRLVGRTEADVAREVRERLLAEGHEVSEFSIVASGPNSASPHHDASDRVIRAGEPIVVDIGGQVEGYGSDITRTLWVTGGDASAGPDAEFLRLYEVLQRRPGRSRPRPCARASRARRSTPPRAT